MPTKKKTTARTAPQMTLREHAVVAARAWLSDVQMRAESQLDALLERLGLVRKSQV